MAFSSRRAAAALQLLIGALLLLVAYEVLVLVPAASLIKLGVATAPAAYLIAAVIAVGVLICAAFALRRAPGWLTQFATVAPAGRFNGVLLAIGVGLLLRIALQLIADITPKSDAHVYTQMAAMLAEGKPYFYAGRWAYWPVGYPFLLSNWFRIGGGSIAGIYVLNLLLFVALGLGVWQLCKAVAAPAAGRLAVWLLALWPDLIALSGWPSKELVALALLPWCVALMISPATTLRATLARRIGAGVLSGLLVLVQPSFILLVPVLPVIAWLANTQAPRQILLTWVLCVVCAAATIAPWTIRNYRVLGAFVPVATNGGEVLYRANNPLATGEYIKVGEVDLWVLPELEANRQGMKLAKEWIAAHPREFLALAMKKQAFLLEDDAIGVYEVFNRGHVGAPVPGAVYFVLKAACNAFWVLLWALLGGALIIVLRRAPQDSLRALALSLPFLYLYGIHSIFESGPRYHQPADPFVAVAVATLLGLALARGRVATRA